jgi:magnesium-transporting ATPase (P-type)
MCADLGQIKYVLSDKTGTLTKNLMVVQHFSIADRVFGDPISVGGEDVDASFTSTGACSHCDVLSCLVAVRAGCI